MCRYDEGDWLWILDHYEDATATSPVRCADCRRTIEPGEAYTVVVGDPGGGEEDDREYVTVAEADGYIVVFDVPRWEPGNAEAMDAVMRDHDERVDAFEALGFAVDEQKDPRVPMEMVREPWCNQCRAANEWLREVCDQESLLVAHEDIDHHLDEYVGWTQLGPAFMKLAWFSSRKWRDRRGDVVPVERVRDLTTKAIAYAHGPRGLLSIGGH